MPVAIPHFHILLGVINHSPLAKGWISMPEILPLLSVWKTVKLGTHKSPESLLQSFKDKDFSINDYAQDLLRRTVLSPYEKKIELCTVSAEELGLQWDITRASIYARAIDLKFGLVPAEVGPELRLQYPDQPYDEVLIIGMESIATRNGYPALFSVEHDNHGRWLETHESPFHGHWGLRNRWVFTNRQI